MIVIHFSLHSLFQKYPFPMIFMDATILLYYKTGTNGHIVNSCSTRIYKGHSGIRAQERILQRGNDEDKTLIKNSVGKICLFQNYCNSRDIMKIEIGNSMQTGDGGGHSPSIAG